MKNFCFALSIALTINMRQVFASEEGMPQLNPEFWMAQIFWLIVILSSLYIILWKIFLPKITDSIENRKLKVVNDLNEAQTLKENAEIKLKEYDQIIEETKIESKKLLENSKKKVEEDIKNKSLIFNKEIEKEILSTENEIENLKKNSVQSINKIAIETSSEIIKQITGAEVNGSNVSAIVDDISRKSMEKYK
jgi:F-type H+-transporting ATPase subunit b